METMSTTLAGAPTDYTPEQLSRVRDAVDLCKHIDTYCNTETLKAFWYAIPPRMRYELNLTHWDYVPKR